MSVRLADVISILDAAYPPALAEGWDTGIGLTCGDPDQEVRRVLLAVDVDPATVAEAAVDDAQLLLTHHPLLFRPVQSIAASTLKGSLLHPLIASGIAHFSAHTNADRAVGGVNDALADALGLCETTPLIPADAAGLDKIVVFVPRDDTDRVIAALAEAGAGAIGHYTEAAFVSDGEGRFRPMPGAAPAVGTVGSVERVAEQRVEMVLPRHRRAAVVAALRAAHPYEEPAYDLYRMVPEVSVMSAASGASGPVVGLGRVGKLRTPMSLREFAGQVARALPATAAGIRAAGDLDRLVTTVAVCGGAGGSALDRASASGADVYVTSDLTHHAVAEHVADPSRPAVIDVPHWAGEWPWLDRAATVLREAFGSGVSATVSTRRTDAWTLHCASGERVPES